MADIYITVSDMLTGPAARAAAENPFAALTELGRTRQDSEATAERTDNTTAETEARDEGREGDRPDTVELSDEELRQLEELRAADRNARAHEQAHRAVGGQYIRGGPYYQFERGPDGRLYAVTGEVTIDVSEIPDDPEATARKMEQVQRAALAPRDPSAQDRRVAAQAAAKAASARVETMRQRSEEARDTDRAADTATQPAYPPNTAAIDDAAGLLINALA